MSCPLSSDVLLSIGDWIEDQPDRLNLIFASRQFHDLFLPLLYRHATLKNRRGVYAFTSAILRRPELARSVRALDFRCWKPTPAEEGIPSCDRFRQLLVGASHSEEEQEKWENDLKTGNDEAWMALPLSLLCNLRRVDLVYPKQSLYLDRTFRRAMEGVKPFHAEKPVLRFLEAVSLKILHHDDDSSNTDSSQPVFCSSQLLPFFHFPSMRTISADSVIETPTEPENPTMPTSRSTISEIDLTCSNSIRGMASFIARCSNLASFKYQHSDSHLESRAYCPSAFSEALSTSKGSLETLWLDSFGTHLPFTMAGLNHTHDEWLGSLEGFTALTELRVRLPNLIDIRYRSEPTMPLIDVLPGSLERIFIEGCDERSLPMLISQLETLVRHRKTKMANLNRIEVEGFFHQDPEDAGDSSDAVPEGYRIRSQVITMTGSLREACDKAEIEFFIRDRLVMESMI
ncbi:hypothetical protein ASPZODRAFT_126734 [Penicilliopsis zonata CBS 506.65]|uniref:Leucine-rich repeat domain-containing protein n=1 Tax=Penicilliopsis zonata CBS 506.65 TaxID=1073090 RepID=A0A1L9SUJ2_9EURO|nr:hypothetical protein ASPZODRAFT_126734 [Penicilliopsis zonata CBS 506.65]OJJ50791.1 hypothetical protein ASPZODRAFT_126734 [Penicilliopsis zonata CBS 506.65]